VESQILGKVVDLQNLSSLNTGLITCLISVLVAFRLVVHSSKANIDLGAFFILLNTIFVA